MTFDKSKVYTALNADELHAGDTVYVADNLRTLRKRVENDVVHFLKKIENIEDDCNNYRFAVDNSRYMLAYLVKRR